MNEQLAIKRSMQLMSLFGGANSSKDLLNLEPDVRCGLSTKQSKRYCFVSSQELFPPRL